METCRRAENCNQLYVFQVIRDNSETEYECSRQGYFRGPSDCNEFFRCVKFNQYEDIFTVFRYNCPEGLVFDEKWEVCVWPSQTAPCGGSSEIFPIPRRKFVCPGEGFFADPENCRWFFACKDYIGDGSFTQYEFRCPFGLVFDEREIKCLWPWQVPNCGTGVAAPAFQQYATLTEGTSGGAYRNNQLAGGDSSRYGIREYSQERERVLPPVTTPGYISQRPGSNLIILDNKPFDQTVSTGCINCESASVEVHGDGYVRPDLGLEVAYQNRDRPTPGYPSSTPRPQTYAPSSTYRPATSYRPYSRDSGEGISTAGYPSSTAGYPSTTPGYPSTTAGYPSTTARPEYFTASTLGPYRPPSTAYTPNPRYEGISALTGGIRGSGELNINTGGFGGSVYEGGSRETFRQQNRFTGSGERFSSVGNYQTGSQGGSYQNTDFVSKTGNIGQDNFGRLSAEVAPIRPFVNFGGSSQERGPSFTSAQRNSFEAGYQSPSPTHRPTPSYAPPSTTYRPTTTYRPPTTTYREYSPFTASYNKPSSLYTVRPTTPAYRAPTSPAYRPPTPYRPPPTPSYVTPTTRRYEAPTPAPYKPSPTPYRPPPTPYRPPPTPYEPPTTRRYEAPKVVPYNPPPTPYRPPPTPYRPPPTQKPYRPPPTQYRSPQTNYQSAETPYKPQPTYRPAPRPSPTPYRAPPTPYRPPPTPYRPTPTPYRPTPTPYRPPSTAAPYRPPKVVLEQGRPFTSVTNTDYNGQRASSQETGYRAGGVNTVVGNVIEDAYSTSHIGEGQGGYSAALGASGEDVNFQSQGQRSESGLSFQSNQNIKFRESGDDKMYYTVYKPVGIAALAKKTGQGEISNLREATITTKEGYTINRQTVQGGNLYIVGEGIKKTDSLYLVPAEADTGNVYNPFEAIIEYAKDIYSKMTKYVTSSEYSQQSREEGRSSYQWRQQGSIGSAVGGAAGPVQIQGGFRPLPPSGGYSRASGSRSYQGSSQQQSSRGYTAQQNSNGYRSGSRTSSIKTNSFQARGPGAYRPQPQPKIFKFRPDESKPYTPARSLTGGSFESNSQGSRSFSKISQVQTNSGHSQSFSGTNSGSLPPATVLSSISSSGNKHGTGLSSSSFSSSQGRHGSSFTNEIRGGSSVNGRKFSSGSSSSFSSSHGSRGSSYTSNINSPSTGVLIHSHSRV